MPSESSLPSASSTSGMCLWAKEFDLHSTGLLDAKHIGNALLGFTSQLVRTAPGADRLVLPGQFRGAGECKDSKGQCEHLVTCRHVIWPVHAQKRTRHCCVVTCAFVHVAFSSLFSFPLRHIEVRSTAPEGAVLKPQACASGRAFGAFGPMLAVIALGVSASLSLLGLAWRQERNQLLADIEKAREKAVRFV